MSKKVKVLISTLNMDKATWRQYRKNGIGGSDVGSICGINPYSSPMRVYLDKIGEAPEIEENEKMYFGNVLEEVVAKEFAKRTGKKVKRRNAILKHPEHEFMIANVDREIVGENSILECKTASAYLEKAWENGIPESYQLQCFHYMAVGGYDRAYIACLIGGSHFVWYTLERDEDMISSIIEIEKDFWSKVVNRIPPQIDGSDATTSLLNAMYKNSDSKLPVIQLESSIEVLIEEREQAKADIKKLEEKVNLAENTLKSLIGESEAAETNGYFITWKNSKGRETFDTKLFNKEHPELEGKYIKQGNSFRTIKINRKEQ